VKAAVRFISCCLIALAASGCASLPPVEVGQLPPDVAFPAYDSWQFRGRVSLTRGEEGWHAGVNWQEEAGVYDLRLSGPLGQGAVQVEGTQGLVRLTAANGQVIIANDADALVADVTGWRFPVSGIRYWVRGLPAPAPQPQAVISRDEAGRLQRLEQSGWDIRYTRFQSADGWNWPTRLRLTTDELVVRLVIDEWILPAPAAGAAPQPAAGTTP
jgi:outer membrane lipoprotein LolB